MEQKQCNGCSYQNNCQKIYQQISNAKGPSVLAKTILALLLPLIIFIATAATCEKVLVSVIANQHLRVILGILSGMALGSVYVVIVRKWRFENQD